MPISDSQYVDTRTADIRVSTDQTDITYVRPGSWEASPGIPGIDYRHQFATPARDVKQPPDATPGANVAITGPSAVNDTKAPAQNSRPWWWKRNASQFLLDNQNGANWGEVTGEPQPQNDTQRPLDYRTFPLVAPRWTAMRGPVTTAYLNRLSEHNMTGERRFADVVGASFAYTATLRPNPMQFGDGLPNIPRFRTTQRTTPMPTDQQIVSQDQQAESGYVLATGGTDLTAMRWW